MKTARCESSQAPRRHTSLPNFRRLTEHGPISSRAIWIGRLGEFKVICREPRCRAEWPSLRHQSKPRRNRKRRRPLQIHYRNWSASTAEADVRLANKKPRTRGPGLFYRRKCKRLEFIVHAGAQQVG